MTKPPSRKKRLSQLLQGTIEVFASENCDGTPFARFDAELLVSKGDGAKRPATGYLYSEGRQVGTMRATFPAELFEPSRRTGAPKKIARDVAIRCALALCEVRQTEKGEAGAIAARKEVVALWQRCGFKGLKNEKHVRDRLPLSLEAVKGTASQFVYLAAQGPSPVILFEKGSKWTVYDDCAFVNGSGWFWMEGNEEAWHGKFKPMRLSWPELDGAAEWAAKFRAALAGDDLAKFILHQGIGPET